MAAGLCVHSDAQPVMVKFVSSEERMIFPKLPAKQSISEAF
jgi:hypothetical protein